MIGLVLILLIHQLFQSTAALQGFLHNHNSPLSQALQVSTKTCNEEVIFVNQLECKFCASSFTTRNALFRHVRTDPICSVAANDGTPDDRLLRTKVRHMLACQFSYWGNDCKAGEAGLVVAETIQQAMREYLMDTLNMTNASVEPISSTQSTVTKMRHRSLSQENGCASCGDVMILSMQAPAAINANAVGIMSDEHHRGFLGQILTRSNNMLTTTATDDLQVRLDSCKYLAPDSKLHAERSCTQLVYHYLLPLQWLPDGLDLKKWWLENAQQDANGHKNRASQRPPNESLRLMKDALRSGESSKLPPLSKDSADNLSIKIATGRFGALGTKERRAWHNYADPNLKGDASPNNEPVWRVLDRARIVRFMLDPSGDGSDEVVALLEFRGDGFLREQVRRIVGTAVAVAHGWLPTDVFQLSTTSDSFMETPLAPRGRLYLAETRFHFDEMRSDGKSLFETDAMGVSARSEWFAMSNEIVEKRLLGESNKNKGSEAKWLKDLENNVAPRIRGQLSRQLGTQHLIGSLTVNSVQVPQIYLRVVEMLRNIIAAGTWPETSAARSSVITNVIGKRQSEIKEDMNQNGSFTVVNPKFQDGRFQNSIGSDSLPLGNSLFPALVEAVFHLESVLAESDIEQAGGILGTPGPRRPASSHCAINANAQFSPHVDSGRGAGQSLSMIVGLGDYSGGDLAVEGDNFDIQYQALEFNGWKLRHWTNPFAGERFSLVWFTPEQKGSDLIQQ